MAIAFSDVKFFEMGDCVLKVLACIGEGDQVQLAASWDPSAVCEQMDPRGTVNRVGGVSQPGTVPPSHIVAGDVINMGGERTVHATYFHDGIHYVILGSDTPLDNDLHRSGFWGPDTSSTLIPCAEGDYEDFLRLLDDEGDPDPSEGEDSEEDAEDEEDEEEPEEEGDDQEAEDEDGGEEQEPPSLENLKRVPTEPEGTFFAYADPEGAGWAGWYEDPDGNVVGWKQLDGKFLVPATD